MSLKMIYLKTGQSWTAKSAAIFYAKTIDYMILNMNLNDGVKKKGLTSQNIHR